MMKPNKFKFFQKNVFVFGREIEYGDADCVVSYDPEFDLDLMEQLNRINRPQSFETTVTPNHLSDALWDVRYFQRLLEESFRIPLRLHCDPNDPLDMRYNQMELREDYYL